MPAEGGKKMNRRVFIKALIATAIGAGLGDEKLSGSDDHSMVGAQDCDLRTSPLPWSRTIFCQSAQVPLRNALDDFARNNQCQVRFCDDDSPDIIAIGSFVHVVDRNLLGRDLWRQYVQFCDETADDAPCLIVDGIKGWGYPTTKCVRQFDPNREKSVESIIGIIRIMRLIMKRNLPAGLRNLYLIDYEEGSCRNLE